MRFPNTKAPGVDWDSDSRMKQIVAYSGLPIIQSFVASVRAATEESIATSSPITFPTLFEVPRFGY